MPIVDLSAPITTTDPEAPRFARTVIEYTDHSGGAAEIEELFGVSRRLLRNGEGWSRETFTYFGTHNSTHVDAPYHYNSVIAGRPAETIDQLPPADALAEDRDGIFWQAHQCDLPYSQIERLFNLSALPPTGFTVACFPLRIVGASAAPARVVAIVE